MHGVFVLGKCARRNIVLLTPMLSWGVPHLWCAPFWVRAVKAVKPNVTRRACTASKPRIASKSRVKSKSHVTSKWRMTGNPGKLGGIA